MIKEAIEKVTKGTNLSEAEAYQVFDEIMSGAATHSQITALLVALRTKGETVDEITGAAKVMREKAVKVNVAEDVLVDTCGTGGSGVNTFNISTAVAFVAAGCGIKVAKHGNRSASSQCGSADVLEALGVNLDKGTDIVEKCIREIGIGFMYAPLFHGAMKHASAPRKEIGTRTIFNLLGPLSNPAGATSQVVGVYDSRLTALIAAVLKNLGTKRAFVVCGMDKLDEITITGKTRVSELKDGTIRTYYVTPGKFGFKTARIEDIRGGTARENADAVLSVLKGEEGPRREVVLMNASAAIIAGYRAKGFKRGVHLAAESIDSGRALEKLNKLVEYTSV